MYKISSELLLTSFIFENCCLYLVYKPHTVHSHHLCSLCKNLSISEDVFDATFSGQKKIIGAAKKGYINVCIKEIVRVHRNKLLYFSYEVYIHFFERWLKFPCGILDVQVQGL